MTTSIAAPVAVTAEDGHRFYPIDDEQYWSVTTALTVLSKDGLTFWAGGQAAKAAFAELPKVLVASRTRPCGNTYSQCRSGRGDNAHDWRITCSTCPCDQCQACMTRWLTERHIAVRNRRADEGKRTHAWIEEWVLSGGVIAPFPDDIAPYVRAFLAFVKAYGLTPESWLFSEAIVINRDERYAGQTDGAIRFEATATDLAAEIVAMLHQQPVSVCRQQQLYADVLVDVKTKEDPPEKAVKFYDEVSLQLSGYEHAPVIYIRRIGAEEPMPALHGAMALQLRPDMAVPRLCVTDERTFAAFLCALQLYRWRVEFGTASVSSRSFKVPPEPKPVKATTKRAPAKKTAPRRTAAAAKPAAVNPVMAQLKAWPKQADPHPNSLYQDEVPF
jgi:hypothetical protein